MIDFFSFEQTTRKFEQKLHIRLSIFISTFQNFHLFNSFNFYATRLYSNDIQNFFSQSIQNMFYKNLLLMRFFYVKLLYFSTLLVNHSVIHSILLFSIALRSASLYGLAHSSSPLSAGKLSGVLGAFACAFLCYYVSVLLLYCCTYMWMLRWGYREAPSLL